MKTLNYFKSFLLWGGALIAIIMVHSCSEDDDSNTSPRAVGMITVGEYKSLSNNILEVESVTVGQDSWLAAVHAGEENTNNFIAQPVMVKKGTTTNIKLSFNENAIQEPDGQLIALKLYADNSNRGNIGEWDTFDEPIKLGNELLIKIITVQPDLTNFNWYKYYDSNGDGILEEEEIFKTYPSIFDFYSKNQITPDEFYLMIYYSTDTDLEDGLTEDEWEIGYLRMFSNWVTNDFTEVDKDKNSLLDLEEWYEIFDTSEWFNFYDLNTDNRLIEEELNKGFFQDWDLNNDNKIDEAEFNNYWPFALNMKFTAPVWEW